MIGTLISVVLQVLVVVTALLLAGFLGLARRGRLELLRREGRQRVREAVPAFILLIGVLLLNATVRERLTELSWIIGVNITNDIYALEGGFVPWVQSFATPAATVYFSSVYVYGYVFILVFPLMAYLLHPDPSYLRETAVAYALNYVLGLVCYTAFIAYGPRNLLVHQVEPLLYATYPQFQVLVSEVNTNTNVFPSLHTSLSLTAATFAILTRKTYRVWAIIAPILAGSIIISTMYLGIHWATDVVAGAVLAGVCVSVARSSISARVLDRLGEVSVNRLRDPDRWL